MAERKVVKSFLFGAVSGAALGAAAALLFAPKPGKALRKDLADTAQFVGAKTADIGKAAGGAAQTIAKKSADWTEGVRAKFSKKSAEESVSASEESAAI